MKKSILKSSTTQSVAGAGATAATVITLLQILQQIFPNTAWLNNPAILGASTWFLNTIFLPFASRMIARYRGK